MDKKSHPKDPHSNVNKFSGYNPDKYALDNVTTTILTDEAITPGRPPCLTQKTVGMFLQPLTRELVEIRPRPTIDELPEAVIEKMVQKDKAFWVDKPGANAYTLHDAYFNYGMTTEMVKPNHQDVFPRSYQYDLDCVRYRRQHGCDGLNNIQGTEKPLGAHCRNCGKLTEGLTPFQLAWAPNASQKRWRNYPDLTATMSAQEIRECTLKRAARVTCGTVMELAEKFTHLSISCVSFPPLLSEPVQWNLRQNEKDRRHYATPELNGARKCDSCGTDRVGRPFQNEACNWYYKNYPPVKYDCILRKFSK